MSAWSTCTENVGKLSVRMQGVAVGCFFICPRGNCVCGGGRSGTHSRLRSTLTVAADAHENPAADLRTPRSSPVDLPLKLRQHSDDHCFLSLLFSRTCPRPFPLRHSRVIRAAIGQSQGFLLSHWPPDTSIRVTLVTRVGVPWSRRWKGKGFYQAE